VLLIKVKAIINGGIENNENRVVVVLWTIQLLDLMVKSIGLASIGGIRG